MAGKDRNNQEHQKEYKGLVDKRKNTESKINSCEDRIESLDNKIRRLKKVKDELTDLKSDFWNSVYKEDARIKKEKRKTRGDEYDFFKSKMDVIMSADEDYHQYTLDFVLDSINNKITKYENTRADEYGLLGDLYSAFNSLGNMIENFFN